MRIVVPVLVLLALVAAGPAQAALRCDGQLVDVGDTAAELVLACGEPLFRQVVAIENTSKTEGIVEQWTYSFGQGTLLQIVTIEAGVIARIEDGDRQ